MSTQIYVGNLAYKMTEDSLRDLFEQHGEVTSVKIIKDRDTGRSKGFGFIEMAASEEAENAIKSLNDTEALGRNLRVNIAKPRKT